MILLLILCYVPQQTISKHFVIFDQIGELESPGECDKLSYVFLKIILKPQGSSRSKLAGAGASL